MVKILRVLRVLRPLRAINRAKGLKVQIGYFSFFSFFFHPSSLYLSASRAMRDRGCENYYEHYARYIHAAIHVRHYRRADIQGDVLQMHGQVQGDRGRMQARHYKLL